MNWLAAGLFGVSIAFMTNLRSNTVAMRFLGVLVAGWAALALSLVFGAFHMQLWSRYFMTYFRSTSETERRRRALKRARRMIEALQLCSLGIGLVMLFVFAATNVLSR